tara:strand:+ start:474 stop:689 length:216 start_codon:yes stop_codon:yes gene_type:complete
MNQALKDLELVRRQERKRARILFKAEKDLQDIASRKFWEDQLFGALLGAGLFVLFFGICFLLGLLYANITL